MTTIAPPQVLDLNTFGNEGIRGSAIFNGPQAAEHNENHRIISDIDLNSWAAAILKKMTDAAQKHPDVGISVILSNIKIHIADGGGYAYTFQEDSGNGHIIIDTKLLQMCKTEDEIAFVIGHELGHRIYRQMHRLSSGSKVSVLEEMYCDKMGLELSVIAGYSAEGGPQLFSHLIQEKEDIVAKHTEWAKKWVNRIGSVLDEHLALETRYSNVRLDFPGIDRLLKGGIFQHYKATTTDIPNFVYVAAASVNHIPVFTQRCEEKQYASLAFTDKVHFLAEFIDEIGSFNARREDFIEALKALSTDDIPSELEKRKDAAVEMEKLLIKLQDISQDGAHPLFKTADKIISQTYARISDLFDILEGRTHTLHEPADESLVKFRQLQPLGRLAQAEEGVIQALLTGSDGEVLTAGRNLVKWQKQFQCSQGSVKFNRLKDHPARQRFVELAAKDESGETATILFTIIHPAEGRYKSIDSIPLAIVERMSPDVFEKGKKDKMANYLALRRERESLSIPMSEFLKDPELFFRQNAHLIRIPPVSARVSMEHPFNKVSVDERWRMHVEFMESLTGEWTRILATGSNEDKAKLHAALFANSKNYSKSPFKAAANVWFLSLEDEIYSDRIPQDPLISFIRSAGDTVSLGDKLYLLSVIPEEIITLDEVFSIISESKPASFQSLSVFCQDVSASSHASPWIGSNYPSKLFQDVIDGSKGAINHPNDILAIVKAGQELQKHDKGIYNENTRTSLVGLQDREAAFALAVQSPSEITLSLDEFLDTFEFIGKAGLFHNSANRKVWCDEALSRVQNCTDPNAQLIYAEHLLKLTKPMRDVNFKNGSVAEWTKAAAKVFGMDDGSAEYQERILERLLTAKELVGSDMRVDLAAELAETIVSQPTLAYALRDAVTLKAGDLHRYNIVAKASEELLKAVETDSGRSKEILDFLTAPLTPESIEGFIAIVDKWRYDEGGGLFNSLIDDRMNNEDRKREMRLLSEDLYKHFWDLDTPLRVVAIKQLLIPPVRYYHNPEETFQNAAETVIRKIFPQREYASPTEARDAKWGEDFIRTFLVASHESEWGFILGAIMAASRQDENIAEASTGKKIKAILECLGPAYIKLGQAMHSFPGTPGDIRKELSSLKGHAAPPRRWDLFQLIDKVVPNEDRAKMVWFGAKGGSASFNMTIEYKDNASKTNLFAILREHSLARSLKGFDTLSDVSKELCRSHPELQSFQQDAMRILDNARSMTLLETDMNQGYKQYQSASEQYHGLTISIEGDTFAFAAPLWNWYGKEYRSMQYAPGLHFDELPENTPQEKSLKQKIATALFVAEIQQILSGNTFDCDRHEWQYKMHRQSNGQYMIYAFDHGGMSMDKPNLTEKVKLTGLLNTVFSRIAEGGEIQNVVYAALNNAAQDSDYFTRIQKGLLAQSFAFKHLSTETIKDLFSVILNGAEIDKTIRSGLIRELAKKDWRAYLLLFRPLAKRFTQIKTGVSIARGVRSFED